MGAADIFHKMSEGLKTQGAGLVEKAKSIFEWKVGSETWTLDLKNGSGSVTKGSSGKADVTLTMAEDVFEQLVGGKLNAQQAFMQGKLKIGGNMGAAMKLGPILQGLGGAGGSKLCKAIACGVSNSKLTQSSRKNLGTFHSFPEPT